MTQKTGNTLAKWTVRFLLAILIASFGLWGIADYASAPVDPEVAVTGDREIRTNDFLNAAQRRINAIRRQNRNFDQRMAVESGIYNQVLSALIDRNALLNQGGNWGLDVSDDAIATEIRKDPTFQGSAGNFDRLRFNAILRNAGYSEAWFIESMRNDIINRQIESSVTAGLDRGQTNLARTMLAYGMEARSLRLIQVPNDKLVPKVSATDDELRAYHTENAGQFSTPERRSGRVLAIQPSALAKEVVIDDQPVRENYEANLDKYTTPETRAVRQAIFDDETAAQTALSAISDDKTFEQVVKEATGAPPVDLGKVGRTDIPGEVGDAAFAADANSIAGPVKSDFGWHLVAVGEVTPETIRTLDDARPEIIERLQMDAALEEMFEYANRVEDELAGGGDLDQVATALAFDPVSLSSLTRGGKNGAGEMPAADLPGETMNILFATAPGDELSVTELGDGTLLLVETTEITAPTLIPFDETKDKVTKAWTRKKRAELAATARDKLLERLTAGAKLDKLAKELGVKTETEEGVTRRSGAAALSGDFRDAVFAADAGGSVAGPSPGGDKQVLVVIDTITAAEITDDDSQLQDMARTMGAALAEDIRAKYVESVRNQTGFIINQPAFRRAVDPNGIYLN